MTENAKKFLAFASKNEAVSKKLEECSASAMESVIALAASYGFTLTEEDFSPSSMHELAEDELKAVSGGAFTCGCSQTGHGHDENGGFCFCPRNGSGFSKDGSDYWTFRK